MAPVPLPCFQEKARMRMTLRILPRLTSSQRRMLERVTKMAQVKRVVGMGGGSLSRFGVSRRRGSRVTLKLQVARRVRKNSAR